MAGNDRDDDYLKKLADVDENVRQRLDREFGQLRVVALIGALVLVLVFVGRWIFGV